jgi:nuclear pore complex protein Nup85
VFSYVTLLISSETVSKTISGSTPGLTLSCFNADDLMLYSSSGAVELLKRLEEVHLGASQGAGDDYLSILMVTMKGSDDSEALQRLKSARLSLAKYYAKCTMVAGGRDTSGSRVGIIVV